MATENIKECPNCGSQMNKKEALFHYHGSYLGNFEAYVCGVCHHVYFTENAKGEIMNVPTALDDFRQFIEQEVN
jgi:ribosomal protein S27AE